MKSFRLSVLLALTAVLVLVTLPASADMRGIPASDGHPQATIEGTITSVSAATSTAGPTVTLLGGLVSFDATGATVSFVDGRDATTATLAAGQRVLAILDPTASPVKATTVVILSDRADVTLTGKVDAVDSGAGTLTVLGFKVKVTDKTVFGGPWDGAGQTGLADLKLGDLVLVDAIAESDALVAKKVMKLSPSPEPTQRVHGTVDSVGTDSWSISLADGTKSVVKIDAGTKFVGAPKVGDEVDVLARRQSDGALLAVLIQKTVAPASVPTQRYMGVVKSIGTTSLAIGPRMGGGPDHVFTVNAATKIDGAPKVGDDVGVLAQRQADGSSLAVAIARVTTPALPVSSTSFDGIVRSLPTGKSFGAAGSLLGTWLIDTTQVVVTSATQLKGHPKVGDKVHIEGSKTLNGPVFAALIETL